MRDSGRAGRRFHPKLSEQDHSSSLGFHALTTDLVERMARGDRRALSRLFTLLERGPDYRGAIASAIHPMLSGAYVIGVTGPPGAGKSTIVDGLVRIFRESEARVGVLAVDPSSPYSGGAVLGDRVRMQRHYLDTGVFIRSLASRGDSGGLSRVAPAAIRLLDASGVDVVLVETVGVGQTELDIVAAADTVVVTLVPEAGDGVQAMKAGLVEIGDVFVVNKADRPGAERAASDIRSTLSLGVDRPHWDPPVVMTEAHRGEGLGRLRDKIEEHRRMIEQTGTQESRRSERRRSEFALGMKEAAIAEIDALLSGDGPLSRLAARVEAGDLGPDAAIAEAIGDGRGFVGMSSEGPPLLRPGSEQV